MENTGFKFESRIFYFIDLKNIMKEKNQIVPDKVLSKEFLSRQILHFILSFRFHPYSHGILSVSPFVHRTTFNPVYRLYLTVKRDVILTPIFQ